MGSSVIPVVQRLRHFDPNEFGKWGPWMSERLLEALDEFRHALMAPVMISPADGSLGRFAGDSGSQHNIDKWDEVRAADVMAPRTDVLRAYEVARELGMFSGIGLYPHWRPYPGLHLDVRESATPEGPALWGAIKNECGRQVYVPLDVAKRHAGG